MSKPPKRKLTPQGVRIKAGRLMTEKTNRLYNDLEWLALLCWDRATGYIEKHVTDDCKDTEIIHAPDKGFISMIWERLEGKVAPVVKDGDKKAKVADRIAEQSKKRANRLAE